jgi:membrane complex biogenesis BtpA family protein
MINFRDYIQDKKVIVGMIHLKALPGTPFSKLPPEKIIESAIKEAKIYKRNGINVVAIENMHDIPYVKNPGPEIISLMAIIGKKVKELGLYCGIQILAGANKEALAVAHAAGLDFIRVENFVYGHVADEGYMDACAGELLRYRKSIGAENILIFTDIKKKHASHVITSDISIEEAAKTADFFMSDGLIITGISTGKEPDLEEVKRVRKVSKNRIIIGSGITKDNLKKYFDYADIFIVGSYFKKGGYWKNDLDERRIKEFMQEFKNLTKKWKK